jgi:hypothetical protein
MVSGYEQSRMALGWHCCAASVGGRDDVSTTTIVGAWPPALIESVERPCERSILKGAFTCHVSSS